MAGTKGRSGGHNAKTQEQLRQSGTFRDDRHGHFDSLEAPKGTPERPMELDDMAGAEWDRMIRRLKESKAISTVDDGVLYQYCQLFAETEQIKVKQLENDASIDIVEENLGELKGTDLVAAFQEIGKMRKLDSRYIDQIRQGRVALKGYLVEFGLTPASRGRVRLPKAEAQKTSKLVAFMGGKA